MFFWRINENIKKGKSRKHTEHKAQSKAASFIMWYYVSWVSWVSGCLVCDDHDDDDPQAQYVNKCEFLYEKKKYIVLFLFHYHHHALKSKIKAYLSE